jgi:hypothetical protein
MDFFNPSVTFKGAVQAENAPSADNHLVRKQDVSALSFINGIASGSSSMLSVADGELSISSLAITDVHVDSTQTSLANFISNEGSTAASLKEGDVLILTAPSAGTETFMVSGADGSAAGNYTQIESPLTAAEVGGVLQAGDGISVNAANATISANIAAGSGLSANTSSGQITFSFSGNSDIVSEGSSNQYFTQARARASIQASSDAGNLIQYTNASGDMLVSTANVRGVLSGGTAITYNSGTGQIAFSGDTDDVAEGSSNQYFTQARSRASVQAASDSGNLLQYTNASGDMLVSTANVRGVLSAGTGLSYNSGTGAFSLNATTSNVAEGSNLYYTDARVRAAVTAGSESDELITYNGGTGAFSLRLQDLRHESQVTLTANVAQTITHNLGKKLVHVSVMDSAGNLIHLDVVYVSTTALTVKSVTGITVDVAISV